MSADPTLETLRKERENTIMAINDIWKKFVREDETAEDAKETEEV